MFDRGDRRNVRFWLDNWIGDVPLASAYPSLFVLAIDKVLSIYSIIQRIRDSDVKFTRALSMSFIPIFVDLFCFLNSYQWTEKDATRFPMITKNLTNYHILHNIYSTIHFK